jgi:DNA polymerase III delta prime subunit
MSSLSSEPRLPLLRSLETGRIHSAYLLSGPGEAPRQTALWFVRALVCQCGEAGPCGACAPCRRSTPGEEIPLDGSGKKGPLFRHLGDHPDLLWVERGQEDTRVRIGQIRALQGTFRLRGSGAGRRAAVIADAEWLNQEAQNALLRLLEEPPPRTTLVLVAASGAGLLPTVRSRCQRVAFPADARRSPLGPDASDEERTLVARLEDLSRQDLPDLLEWAEAYRGPRAIAASEVSDLLGTASAWLRQRVAEAAEAGRRDLRRELDAFDTLKACRKSLIQRNANPQMVAERALLALREATVR